MNRILYNLFPHNFPKLYAARGGEASQTVRKRINSEDVPIQYPFSEVIRECQEIGFPLRIDEGTDLNFIVGNDGGEYYVDSILTENSTAFFCGPETDLHNPFNLLDNGKLKPEINQRLNEEQRKQILGSLIRLKELSIIKSFAYILKEDSDVKSRFIEIAFNEQQCVEELLDKSGFSKIDELPNIIRILRATDIIVPDQSTREIKEVIMATLRKRISKFNEIKIE